MGTSIEQNCENEIKLIRINHKHHHKLGLITRYVLMLECVVIFVFYSSLKWIWSHYYAA